MITIKDTKELESFFEKDGLYDRKRYRVHEVKLFGLTIWKTIEDLVMNVEGKSSEGIGFTKRK